MLAVLIAAERSVNINFTITGVLALIAGILLLVAPALLRYIVAGYLILVGLIQVFDVG